MKNAACGALLKQINDTLEKNANNQLRADGLTLSQLGLLMLLDGSTDGELTFKELEKALHIAQPTVVGLISRLEQKGLLMTRGDETDKRVKIACLTPAGKQKCLYAKGIMQETEEQLLAGFSVKDKEQFLDYLEKVAANIE